MTMDSISSTDSEPPLEPPLAKGLITRLKIRHPKRISNVYKYITLFIVRVYRNDSRLDHIHALPLPVGR